MEETPDTLIINVNKFWYRSRMAAFDYDQTLVKPKSNTPFSKSVDDWTWLRPGIPDKLRDLYKKGYGIVIFTNQTKKKEFKVQQIRNAIGELKIPVKVFIEFNKAYQKPNPYMYNLYIRDKSIVNKSKSFFVGDALGRPHDFSDSDKQFAIKCQIQYIAPEEMFPFKTHKVSQKINIPGYREIVLMMGYPGSGKTSFVKTTFGSLPNYEIIHGDAHVTESKLKKAFKSSLQSSKSIVLDATHSSIQKRKKFIDLAIDKDGNDIPVRVIHVSTSIEESMYRNSLREKPIPKIAMYMYRKHFEAPKAGEGFYEIITI